MKKIQILALVFALLTGISIYIYLGTLKNTSKYETADVVVAVKTINAHTSVTDDMITVKKLPAEAVNADAIRRKQDIIGKITNVQIETDEQILNGKLLKTGQNANINDLTAVIPKDKRAITIPVDDVAGISGFIKPGDFVDVLVILSVQLNGQNAAQPASFYLLQNIQVLASGSNLSASQKTQYSTVTLAATPEQTLKLNYAATYGKIRLVLRSPADSTVQNITPQTISGIAH